jgi:hypothetical protein
LAIGGHPVSAPSLDPGPALSPPLILTACEAFGFAGHSVDGGICWAPM